MLGHNALNFESSKIKIKLQFYFIILQPTKGGWTLEYKTCDHSSKINTTYNPQVCPLELYEKSRNKEK